MRVRANTSASNDEVVFACRPCVCGGMCDKCRQTPLDVSYRDRREARRMQDPEYRAERSKPVCLCDPDTDAVCDRDCA